MIAKRSERTGHCCYNSCVLLSLVMIIGILFPTATTALQMRVASFVPDREFPELLPYVMDGWDLKHGMGQPKEYGQLVPTGATLHAFVENESNQPIIVEHVLLNDIDLSKHIVPMHREHLGIRAASYHLNDTTVTPEEVRQRLDNLGDPIWYQVRPDPIPPKGFAEVIVRLRKMPHEKILTIAVEASGEKAVNARLFAEKPAALALASVNFNKEINRMFLYVRRTDGLEFTIRSVEIDGKDVKVANEKSLKSLHGFLPIEIPLPQAMDYGSFHYVAVTTTDTLSAAAVVRARDQFFALGMWGYRNNGNTLEGKVRDTCTAFHDHLFNTHMGMAGSHSGYLQSTEGLKMLEEMGLRLMVRDPTKSTVRNPQLYARFLLDEPDAHEYAVNSLPGNLRVGSYAQGLVQLQRRWTEIDRRTLTLLNVDLTYKPENWLIYGQLPDILAVDPYYQMRLKDTTWKHPGWLAQFCHPYYVYAIAEIARWASQPHPLHIILNSVSFREDDRIFRYGTPEEKRIEFYYALAAGAKGISYWWFTPYGKCRGCGASDSAARIMMREMAHLNAEARAVEPLLAVACPATMAGSKVDSFTSSVPAWLMARTLFAETHTAIIILVNRDHASDRLGTLFQPIPKARVTFQKPPWMDDNNTLTALRLSRAGPETAQITIQDGYVTVPFENFQLTEMLILTTSPTLEENVEKQWKSILPRLEKVLK